MPAAHAPLQAQGIDEHLEAIGRELSGGEPTDEPAPSQDDTTWERADATLEEALRSVPMDATCCLMP